MYACYSPCLFNSALSTYIVHCKLLTCFITVHRWQWQHWWWIPTVQGCAPNISASKKPQTDSEVTLNKYFLRSRGGKEKKHGETSGWYGYVPFLISKTPISSPSKCISITCRVRGSILCGRSDLALETDIDESKVKKVRLFYCTVYSCFSYHNIPQTLCDY